MWAGGVGTGAGLVVLRAGPTHIVGGRTVTGQVPPAMALEAVQRLLFTFFSVDFLLADEQSMHQDLVGSLWGGECEHHVAAGLCQCPPHDGLDPMGPDDVTCLESIDLLHLTQIEFFLWLECQGDKLNHCVKEAVFDVDARGELLYEFLSDVVLSKPYRHAVTL